MDGDLAEFKKPKTDYDFPPPFTNKFLRAEKNKNSISSIEPGVVPPLETFFKALQNTGLTDWFNLCFDDCTLEENGTDFALATINLQLPSFGSIIHDD